MQKKKLTSEELIEAYFEKGKSYAEIAAERGYTRAAVCHWMKEYGLKPRTHSDARLHSIRCGRVPNFKYYDFDSTFFRSWSAGMAWVLGLLYTDGCLRKDCVTLAMVDFDVLEKVRKQLGFTGPIKRKRQSGSIERYIYVLSFSRKSVADDLRSLGLKARKSLNIEFPVIPKEFTRHFIRGCWDGDGCFTHASGKLQANYVSASYSFIESLVMVFYEAGFYRYQLQRPKNVSQLQWRNKRRKLFRKYPNRRFPINIFKRKNGKTYEINICRTENLRRLFEYFYAGIDKSMFMERKYQIFLESIRKENRFIFHHGPTE
jgi:hypothetical protein